MYSFAHNFFCRQLIFSLRGTRLQSRKSGIGGFSPAELKGLLNGLLFFGLFGAEASGSDSFFLISLRRLKSLLLFGCWNGGTPTYGYSK